MKKVLFSLVAVISLTALLLFTSCQKEQKVDTETVEAVIDADNAAAEGIVLAQENSDGTKDTYDSTCRTVTRNIDIVNNTITIIIEFNGVCEDGISRSGKMTIVTALDWRIDPVGKTVTITYENFTRGQRIFNGTVNYTVDVVVDTTDSSRTIVMTTNMDNFTVTFPDSTSVTLSGTKTIEYVKGFFTFWDKTDDILRINSQIEGNNRQGENFTAVSEDLIIKRDCNYFFPISGTKTITFDDGRTYLIDFGDGTCDRIYTVTYDGETYTFEFNPDSE